jgi:DNA polymerase III subunit epsilon
MTEPRDRAVPASQPVPIARQPTLDDLGTPLFETTFVVLDLETTGLAPQDDRITEVGAVKVRAGEVLGELATLVHPGRSIPPTVTAVTGISDGMVRGAPRIEAVLPSLLEFLGSAVLVAHNARFDVSFLRAALARSGHPAFEPVVLDTARLARRVLAEEVRNVRLATLAAHLRARTRPEHRALADARATVDVLHGLIERAGPLGATTLEDLQDLARSTSQRAFRKVDLVREAPRAPGTYRFLGEDDEVLYVGKARDLRRRLRTYFGQDPRRRVADLVRATVRVTWTPTPTELEAEVRELRAIRSHRPRFNRRSKHPERAVHIALTREAFPRLSIVRSPRAAHRLTLGPVTSRRLAEDAAEALQEATGLRPCTPRLRRSQDHGACVLKELGRCAAPCDGTQTAEAYEQAVERFLAACEDPTPVLDDIDERMRALASAGRFERARHLRSRRHAVARVLADHRDGSALAAVDELVVRAADDEGTDVVVVRHGRFAGSVRLPVGVGDAEALAALATLDLEEPDGPGDDDHAEERRLVRAWLERPTTRLLRASGTWSSTVAGGRTLGRVLAEARRVDRQVRRDRQALEGAKVARRTGGPKREADAQRTSKNGLNATGGSALTPDSRPSQLTRAR